MITNEVQARRTRQKIEDFKIKLAELQAEGIRGVMQQAQYDGIASLLADMETELEQYEALKETVSIVVSNIHDLAKALISARIAKKLSQTDLAKRLGLEKQAIQRYEAEEYKGASLNRIIEVADAMNVKFDGTLELE